MTTTLRRVLQAFEEAQCTVRLDLLSRQLNLDPTTLDSMIQYWVRKGQIQEVEDMPDNCNTCHVSGCPFILKMPKRYTLVQRAAGQPTIDQPSIELSASRL